MSNHHFFENFVESMEKDILRQERTMDRQIHKMEEDIEKIDESIDEGLPEVGEKFGDYQEIIEHVVDVHHLWKFINITKIGSSISKFYFANKNGDLILWVKPCEEGWVITKKNVRKFDNRIVKSVEYFG